MLRKQTLNHLYNRMIASYERNISTKKQKFLSVTSKIDAMSPLKVLARGYSITQDVEGRIVSSITQLQTNEPIRITLSDGTVSAIVTKKENNHGKE